MKKIISCVAVMALALGFSTTAKAQFGNGGYRAPCLSRPLHTGVYPGAHPIRPIGHVQPHYPNFQQPCHRPHLPVHPVHPIHPGAGQIPGVGPINIDIDINTIIGNNNVINNLKLPR